MVTNVNSKKKKSSQGSTMMIVLVAVTFIGIIGTIIMFTAVAGYKLKTLNMQNKNSFYTAESAVDEVYTGIGMIAMDSLSGAYTDTLSNMTVSNILGGTTVETELTNTELQIKMRRRYMVDVVKVFLGSNSLGVPYFSDDDIKDGSTYKTIDFNDTSDTKYGLMRTQTLDVLNSTIKNPGNMRVIDCSGVEIRYSKEDTTAVDYDVTNGSEYSLTIKDVTIEYCDSSRRFSKLTVDYVIGYPTMRVVFSTTKGNQIDAFKNFCLIGMNSVEFDTTTATVNSGVYAGGSAAYSTQGLKVSDSTVTFNNSLVASGGNIVIQNQNKTSNATFSSSNIWASNILVKTTNEDIPAGSVNNNLTINGSSSTHLADDLQVDANYSKINVGGDFWGYGYGLNATSDVHDNSSAIILNGKQSSLSMNNLNNLLVAGRAYIYYNGIEKLASTAESLALRGNQRYYMLPDMYLKVNYAVGGVDYEVINSASTVSMTQPISATTYPGAILSVNDDITNFFGYRYLDTTTPVIQKTAGTSMYVYLNFKDNASRNAYLRCLLDKTYFNTEFAGASNAVKDSYDVTLEYTKKYLKSANSSTGITIAGGAKVYANGLLLQYSNVGNSDPTGGAGNSNNLEDSLGTGKDLGLDTTVNPLFVTNMNINFTNRYSIINHTLLELVEKDDTGFIIQTNDKPLTYISEGKTYSIPADMYNRTVFENYIDVNEVRNSPIENTDAEADGEFVCVTTKDVVIPEDAKYGVVISTGNVSVSRSFNGLIIANQRVVVSGNGSSTFSNDISASNNSYDDLLDYIDTSNSGELRKYFSTLEGSGAFGGYEDDTNPDNNKISKLKYTDLVSYTNWRKTIGE